MNKAEAMDTTALSYKIIILVACMKMYCKIDFLYILQALEILNF